MIFWEKDQPCTEVEMSWGRWDGGEVVNAGVIFLIFALALVHGDSSCEIVPARGLCHAQKLDGQTETSPAAPLEGQQLQNTESDPQIFVEVFPNPGLGTLHIIYTVFETEGISTCAGKEEHECVLRFVLDGKEVMSVPFQDSSLSGELEIHWRAHVDSAVSLELALEIADAKHAVLSCGHTTFEYVPELAPSPAMERVVEILSASGTSLHTNAESHSTRVASIHTSAEKFSSVKDIGSEVLRCSNPRSKLRAFHLSRVLIRKGSLAIFLADYQVRSVEEIAPSMQAAFGDMFPERRAPLRVMPGPWHASRCSNAIDDIGGERRVGESEQEREAPVLRTAYLLVGVGTGTVEHFAHFLWDFALNIYRLQSAVDEHARSRQEASAESGTDVVLLQTESMAALMRDRPRRFYEVLSTALGVRWEALDDVRDGTCFRSVAVGFGALQAVPSAEVRDAPALAGSLRCQSFIRAFARRLVAPYPAALQGADGASRSGETAARGRREGGRESFVLVMSRAGERWRRWLNEEELVERWNQERALELSARAEVHVMHHVTFAEQVALVQAAQVVVTCNGAQASAMLLAAPYATVINLYPARWPDQGFGLMQRLALEAIGVRYWQVEVEEDEVIAASELTGLASMRDADLVIRWSRFDQLVSAALQQPFELQRGHASAECQHVDEHGSQAAHEDIQNDCKVSLDLGHPSMDVVVDECSRLLRHFEGG